MSGFADCNWQDVYQWFQKIDSNKLHRQTMGPINSLFHLQHKTIKLSGMKNGSYRNKSDWVCLEAAAQVESHFQN